MKRCPFKIIKTYKNFRGEKVTLIEKCAIEEISFDECKGRKCMAFSDGNCVMFKIKEYQNSNLMK